MTAVLTAVLPAQRSGSDVPAICRLLRAEGIPADRVRVIGGPAVQVRSGWGTRTSADAVRLLKAVGASEDIGSAVELEGREYSGRTPDGTWVYVPCRPLTPYTTAGRGAADTPEATR